MNSPRVSGLQLMLCLLVAAVFGCSRPITEPSLPVNLPTEFSRSGSVPLPGRWWLSFGDPALNHHIKRALNGNLSIAAAWHRLDQALADVRKSESSLKPGLDMDSAVSFSEAGTKGKTSSGQNLSIGLSATYELDLWDRIQTLSNAESWEAKATEADLQAAGITIAGEVAIAWFRLKERYGQLSLIGEQIATNQKTLDLVTVQFRTGKAASADILQQRQLIEAKQGEKTQVIGDIDILKHRLATLLGLPPKDSVTMPTSSLMTVPSLPDTGIPSALIHRRPDIQAAYYRLLAADQRVAAAVSDRFPKLRLTARGATAGSYVQDLFRNWLTSISAGLLGPIIDGQRRAAEVDRSRSAAFAQLNTYGQIVLNALGEVEDALTRESRLTALAASLDKQLKLAEQVILRVKERYTKGIADYDRVLSASLSHQQLERSRLTVQRDLLLNRIALCRSLAGGWEIAQPQSKRVRQTTD